MEHRWGHRIPLDVRVQLVGSPASIGWGRLRDASSSGGFIQTDLALAPLSSVRILLAADGEPMTERNAVQAIVVRRAVSGLGVEWFDHAPEAITAAMRDGAEPRVRHARAR